MRSLGIMYHDVVENGDFASSGFPGEGANIYKLRREDFERHLQAISAAVPSAAISAISARRDWLGDAPVFLTFDDGGSSALHPTADLLEQHGWRGHFFITTQRVGTPGFMKVSELRELHRRGHVIGSHSATHPPRMAALSRAEIDREWRESVSRLREILDEEVRIASVPGGYYSREVARSAAAAGIEVLFTSEPTAGITVVDNCLVLGRFVVMRNMSPGWSAGFARGRRRERWRQAALWNLKRIAKTLGGDTYLSIRKSILQKGDVQKN